MSYIEREKAFDAVFGQFCASSDETEAALNAAIEEIRAIPAADVRPVVLCRDCKNNYNTCLNHGRNEPMCDFTDRKLKEDDFCSRGEKREES